MSRLVLLLAFAASVVWAQAAQSPPPAARPTAGTTQTVNSAVGYDDELPCTRGRKKEDEARFGKYLVRTYLPIDPRSVIDEGCLQILKSDVVVYSLVSQDFKIGKNFEGGERIPLGTDIIGDGNPYAVVADWSGGAHCCFTMHVFQIGDRFSEFAQIDAGESDTAHFVRSRDGTYEFDAYDWGFEYWRTSFEGSPAPRVILKFRDGRYRLATDLMKTPDPSAADFAGMLDDVRTDDAWSSKSAPDCAQPEGCGVPVILWRYMLDLMYGGHPDLAWKLFYESWPKQQDGQATFARHFCARLSDSAYWPELKSTVGACPPAGMH